MSDLVTVKNGELVVADEVINELQDFYVEKTKMELKEKELKKAIQIAMEKNNILSFNNEKVGINYIKEGSRDTVDVDKLKEQGLYDIFKKTSIVKPSVRITWK